MTVSLIAFAGWAGAACLLAGYVLLSTGRIPAGPVFQALNAGGAAGILMNGAAHRAWPSVTLNLAWLLISITALRRRPERPQRLPDDRLRSRAIQ